jgi:hypothetical protein
MGDSRNRPVERQQGQSAGGEILPLPAVTSLGGIDHAALHGAIPFDPGHHDPHQPILSPRPVHGGPAITRANSAAVIPQMRHLAYGA